MATELTVRETYLLTKTLRTEFDIEGKPNHADEQMAAMTVAAWVIRRRDDADLALDDVMDMTNTELTELVGDLDFGTDEDESDPS